MLSLLVVVGVLAAAAPASVAESGSSGGFASGEAGQANATGFGDRTSAFMQSTSGGTVEEVESGMWNAAYENASDRSARSRVVERRADDIAARLDELRAQKQELIAAHRNGSISDAEYRARMSRLVGRLSGLNRSIAETEVQANATGANATRVQRLRTSASELSGPEVAEIARSIPGGNPGVGPPDDVPGQGPPGDDPGSAGNESGPPGDGGPGNGQGGPPDDPPGEGEPGGGDGGDGNAGGGPNERVA